MLCPTTSSEIPEDTFNVARAAFPKGNIYLWMRDEFEQLYRDEEFAALYPVQGQPTWSPWRLALVCILQFMEDLTDREAADAVRSRIDWKYALGLPLSDSGFDYSILSEFRIRLLQGGQEMHLLDQLLIRFQEKNWLSNGGKQRTDSTHILSTIHERSRVEAIHETLRAALNDIAQQAPDWLQTWVPIEWYQDYGKPIDDYHLPKQRDQRTAYAVRIGQDGMTLLERLWQEDAPVLLRQLGTVEHLRCYWIYHFSINNGVVSLRSQTDMPPTKQRSDSPYDPDSHYGNKGSETWHGYKLHVSETCNPDTLHVITHVETTPAYCQDIEQTALIHKALAEKGLVPQQHFVDAGYVDAELLVSSQQIYNIELIGPIKANPSWQAKDPEAFDISHFAIDWEAKVVSCPQGHTSKTWTPHLDPDQNPVITVNFSKPLCRDCPVRERCTRSPTYPRSLTLHPQAEHEAIERLRQQQDSPQWRKQYATRAGVEGTISQAVVGFSMRQSRYRGLAKTRLQHIATAVAINIKRAFAWVKGIPHAMTRISHFAALAPKMG